MRCVPFSVPAAAAVLLGGCCVVLFATGQSSTSFCVEIIPQPTQFNRELRKVIQGATEEKMGSTMYQVLGQEVVDAQEQELHNQLKLLHQRSLLGRSAAGAAKTVANTAQAAAGAAKHAASAAAAKAAAAKEAAKQIAAKKLIDAHPVQLPEDLVKFALPNQICVSKMSFWKTCSDMWDTGNHGLVVTLFCMSGMWPH